jgi:anti-anti-sigma factor
MRRDLEIRSRPEGGATVVEVHGAVENASIEAFDEGLTSAIQSSSRVVVDLSGVDMMTSQGLGLLIKHTEAIGGPEHLLLAGMQPRVRDIFQALGLDQFFVIVDSVAGALSRLSEGSPSEKA